ncbi:hypothetical protein OAZ91_01070 [bacterium]|nr:hypothetical protein [bacterium]
MSEQFWQTNQRDIKNDGSVILFQRRRANDGTVKPTWYMRLLLPEQNGYHTQSTRTKNEFEAGKIALQTYEKFQVRSLSGNTLRTVKFSVALDGWMGKGLQRHSIKRTRQQIH